MKNKRNWSFTNHERLKWKSRTRPSPPDDWLNCNSRLNKIILHRQAVELSVLNLPSSKYKDLFYKPEMMHLQIWLYSEEGRRGEGCTELDKSARSNVCNITGTNLWPRRTLVSVLRLRLRKAKALSLAI